MSHSIGVTLKFAGFAAGTTDCPHPPAGDLVGADHVVALDAALQAARGAWSVADMGRSCHLPFGTFPADGIAGINLVDVLAHSWDIATSTGADLDCPDELWSTGLAVAWSLIGADRDLRHYAAAVAVGRDESPRARFLGFLGRSDADQRARR